MDIENPFRLSSALDAAGVMAAAAEVTARQSDISNETDFFI